MQISMNAPYQVTSALYVDPTTKEKKDDLSLQTNSTQTDKEKNSPKDSKKQQDPNELSDNARQAVTELQARDTEVRAHEAAHQAAGGGMTGGASYTYEKGPDGRMYAVGGEVSISTKGGSTPEETIANARQVQAAAMAPANPSGQDFAVASSAKVMEMKAQQELAKEKQAKMRGEKTYGDTAQGSNDSLSQQDDPLKTTDQEYKPFDISA